MPHISGKKIAKSHSTIISEAKTIIHFAKNCSNVSKIVTGEIKVIPKGPKRLKIDKIPAGLKLMVRGQSSRQQIYIYTSEPKLLAEKLAGIFK